MKEIAAVQVNGKSAYQFNSEDEMKSKFHVLITEKLIEKMDKTLKSK